MSAAGRGTVREPDDFCPTRAYAVARLLDAIDLPGGTWLEPCAGDGAIIRAVNGVRADVRWKACELRTRRAAALRPFVDHVLVGDFLAFAAAFGARKIADVVITNPPYGLAVEFITACRRLAPRVLMLLRLNFLGSEDRWEFWRSAPMPDIWVLPNRPYADATEYAWFDWWAGATGRVRVLDLTPLEERR